MENTLQKVALLLATMALAPHLTAASPIEKRNLVNKTVVPFDIPLQKSDGKWKGDFRAYVYDPELSK